jgi:glycosyltransferase involved in cell wall biosynthesis
MVKECLQSIYSQTFHDWKIILIDDASTDKDTVRYIENLKSWTSPKKVEVHHLQKNVGEMFARVSGKHYLDNDCEYVAFMDSDDIMLPTRFEKQVEFLNDCPKVDILGTQIQLFYPVGTKGVSYKHAVTRHQFNVNDCILREHWSINNPTTMMRREVVEQFDLDSISELQEAVDIPKNTFGDYLFYLVNAREGVQIRNLSEVLLLYRVHGGQLSVGPTYNQENHKRLRM